jgi:two-component system NarL family sensor kinase
LIYGGGQLTKSLPKKTGLINAIELHLSQLKKASPYKVIFEMKGSYSYLDEQTEIILFRILQEAVNNTIRHACADKIEISLLCQPENLMMQIRDNGKGFNTNAVLDHTNGINNMKKRAKLINAIFNINSSEAGTAITVNTPYKTNL